MKGTDVVFGVASVIYSIVSLTLARISVAMVARPCGRCGPLSQRIQLLFKKYWTLSA